MTLPLCPHGMRVSNCKTCRRARQTELQHRYDDANRDTKRQRDNDRYAQWREANPLQPRTARPAAIPIGRHGGPDEWARMWDAQDGLCYLCLRPLPDDKTAIHVDHDHSCHDPGPGGRNTQSCQYCRRGLTHERCNQIWGLAKEDAGLLCAIADNGERVRDETRERIATRPYAQETLWPA